MSGGASADPHTHPHLLTAHPHLLKPLPVTAHWSRPETTSAAAEPGAGAATSEPSGSSTHSSRTGGRGAPEPPCGPMPPTVAAVATDAEASSAKEEEAAGSGEAPSTSSTGCPGGRIPHRCATLMAVRRWSPSGQGKGGGSRGEGGRRWEE